jgi:type VI protein secretion system component Hcp
MQAPLRTELLIPSANGKEVQRIGLLSWHWRAPASASAAGGQAGKGRGSLDLFEASMAAGPAAAELRRLMSTQGHIKILKAELTEAQGANREYLEITMRDATVVGVSEEAQGKVRTAQVTFAFGEVEFQYKTQAAREKPAGSIRFEAGRILPR